MMQGTISLVATHASLWLQAVQVNPNGLTQDQQFQLARQALARGRAAQDLLVPLALFAMVVLIVWLVTRRKQALIQAQMELRKQLLAKFASGPELTAFLESKGGQQFLEEIRWQSPGRSRAGFTVGIVFSVLGLALLGLTAAGRQHNLEPGVVFLAIGGGLLISAAISHRMARQSSQTAPPGPGNQPLLPT